MRLSTLAFLVTTVGSSVLAAPLPADGSNILPPLPETAQLAHDAQTAKDSSIKINYMLNMAEENMFRLQPSHREKVVSKLRDYNNKVADKARQPQPRIDGPVVVFSEARRLTGLVDPMQSKVQGEILDKARDVQKELLEALEDENKVPTTGDRALAAIYGGNLPEELKAPSVRSLSKLKFILENGKQLNGKRQDEIADEVKDYVTKVYKLLGRPVPQGMKESNFETLLAKAIEITPEIDSFQYKSLDKAMKELEDSLDEAQKQIRKSHKEPIATEQRPAPAYPSTGTQELESEQVSNAFRYLYDNAPNAELGKQKEAFKDVQEAVKKFYSVTNKPVPDLSSLNLALTHGGRIAKEIDGLTSDNKKKIIEKVMDAVEEVNEGLHKLKKLAIPVKVGSKAVVGLIQDMDQAISKVQFTPEQAKAVSAQYDAIVKEIDSTADVEHMSPNQKIDISLKFANKVYVNASEEEKVEIENEIEQEMEVLAGEQDD